jgi:hypothetical protein
LSERPEAGGSDDRANVMAKTNAALIHDCSQAARAFGPSRHRLLISKVLMATAHFGMVALLLDLCLLQLGFDTRIIGLTYGVGEILGAVAALPAGKATVLNWPHEFNDTAVAAFGPYLSAAGSFDCC